ncbi:MAG: hypothetical protein AAB092_06395 [Chloroflexota bacterium]
MAKRLFFLLIATLALGGGAYALRGKKTEKRPVAAITTNIPALKLDVPTVEMSPDHREPVAFSPATILTSRIALLIVVGVVLCTGAYLGLGKGSQTARAAVTVQDEIPAGVSLDARAELTTKKLAAPEANIRSGRNINLTPPAAPTPAAPAPTPVVAAEVETPAPVAQPAATPAPLPADGIEAIICALPWPCQQAINVAACESGRDMSGRLDGAWATNGNHYGLFQISWIHASKWADFYDAWMDPAKNAQWAYEIYVQQGWYPWACRWAAY